MHFREEYMTLERRLALRQELEAKREEVIERWCVNTGGYGPKGLSAIFEYYFPRKKSLYQRLKEYFQG